MKTILRPVCLLALTACCFNAFAFAAEKPADAVATNDLLIVSIAGLNAPGVFTRQAVRVDAKGRLSLYHIGEIEVGGLSLRAAEQAIDAAYKNAKVIDQAHASIDRAETGDKATVKSGVITPGELVRVMVLEVEGPGVETLWLLHVSPTGDVGLPALGQTHVAGMTEAEAAFAINKAYGDAGVIVGAVVGVLRVASEADAAKLPGPAAPMPARDDK